MTQTGRAACWCYSTLSNVRGHNISSVKRTFQAGRLDRQSVPLDLSIADLISADPFWEPIGNDMVGHLIALNTVSARITGDNPVVSIYTLRISIDRAWGPFILGVPVD
jgi:hypothetical protein